MSIDLPGIVSPVVLTGRMCGFSWRNPMSTIRRTLEPTSSDVESGTPDALITISSGSVLASSARPTLHSLPTTRTPSRTIQPIFFTISNPVLISNSIQRYRAAALFLPCVTVPTAQKLGF